MIPYQLLQSRAGVILASMRRDDLLDIMNLIQMNGAAILTQYDAVRGSDYAVSSPYGILGSTADADKVRHSLAGLTAVMIFGIRNIQTKSDYEKILRASFAMDKDFLSKVVDDIWTAETPMGFIENTTRWIQSVWNNTGGVIFPDFDLGDEGPNLDVLYEVRVLGEKIELLTDRIRSRREMANALLPGTTSISSQVEVKKKLRDIIEKQDITEDELEDAQDMTDDELALADIGRVYSDEGLGKYYREIGGPFGMIADLALKGAKMLGKHVVKKMGDKKRKRGRKSKMKRIMALAKKRMAQKRKVAASRPKTVSSSIPSSQTSMTSEGTTVVPVKIRLKPVVS